MNKPQKKTKKQHYVPQFYLRQWIDETGGFYPIKTERGDPSTLDIFKEKSNPIRFCYENFFYAQHTGKEDDISQTIEKYFAEVEAKFAIEIPRLEAKIINNEEITYEDKYHLSEFMIFLWLRGKEYREHSQKMSETMYKEITKHTVHYMDKNPETKARMDKLGITKEQMIDFAEKGEYRVEFGNMHHMGLFKKMQGFCNLLSGKYWRVYISRKGEFITGDVPYTDVPSSKNKDVFWGNDFLSREQSFVLSPRVLIVALYPDDEIGKKFNRKDITDKRSKIQLINSHRLMNSIKFGFHKDKALLEELKHVTIELHKLTRQNAKDSSRDRRFLPSRP